MKRELVLIDSTINEWCITTSMALGMLLNTGSVLFNIAMLYFNPFFGTGVRRTLKLLINPNNWSPKQTPNIGISLQLYFVTSLKMPTS